jgi:hypothetical protein
VIRTIQQRWTAESGRHEEDHVMDLNWGNFHHRLVAEAASLGKADVNLKAARQRRIDEERSMRTFLLNSVFTLLLLALCAHAS